MIYIDFSVKYQIQPHNEFGSMDIGCDHLFKEEQNNEFMY